MKKIDIPQKIIKISTSKLVIHEAEAMKIQIRPVTLTHAAPRDTTLKNGKRLE
jgi:hypothetical protein